MTKNKKKLRRAERQCLMSRTAQSLILSGLLFAGGVPTAEAKILAADAPTATTGDQLQKDTFYTGGLGGLNGLLTIVGTNVRTADSAPANSKFYITAAKGLQIGGTPAANASLLLGNNQGESLFIHNALTLVSDASSTATLGRQTSAGNNLSTIRLESATGLSPFTIKGTGSAAANNSILLTNISMGAYLQAHLAPSVNTLKGINFEGPLTVTVNKDNGALLATDVGLSSGSQVDNQRITAIVGDSAGLVSEYRSIAVNGGGSQFTAGANLSVRNGGMIILTNLGKLNSPNTSITQGYIRLADGGEHVGTVSLNGSAVNQAQILTTGGTLAKANTITGALTTAPGRYGSVYVGSEDLPSVLKVTGASTLGSADIFSSAGMNIASGSTAWFTHAGGLTLANGGVLTTEKIQLNKENAINGDVGLVAKKLSISTGGILNIKGNHTYSDEGLSFSGGTLNVRDTLTSTVRVGGAGRYVNVQKYKSTASDADIWDNGRLSVYGAGENVESLSIHNESLLIRNEGRVDLGSKGDVLAVGLTSKGGSISKNIQLSGNGSLNVKAGNWKLANSGNASLTIAGNAGMGLHVDGGSLTVDKVNASAPTAFVQVGGAGSLALLSIKSELKNVLANAFDGNANIGISVKGLGTLEANYSLLVDKNNLAGHYLLNGVSKMYVGAGATLRLLGEGLILTQGQLDILKDNLIAGGGLLDIGSTVVSTGSGTSYADINGHSSQALLNVVMDLTKANALTGVKGGFKGLTFLPTVGDALTPVNVMDTLQLAGGASGTELVAGLTGSGSVNLVVGADEILAFGGTSGATAGHLQGKVTLDGTTALFATASGNFHMDGGVDASSDGFGKLVVKDGSLITDHVGNAASGGNAVGAVVVNNGSLTALHSSNMLNLTLNKGTLIMNNTTPDQNSLNIRDWANLSNSSVLNVGHDLSLGKFTDGTASGTGKISNSTVTVGHDLNIKSGGLKGSQLSMTVGGTLKDLGNGGLLLSDTSNVRLHALESSGPLGLYSNSTLLVESGKHYGDVTVNGNTSEFTSTEGLEIVDNKSVSLVDKGSLIANTIVTKGSLNFVNGGILKGTVSLNGATGQEALITVKDGSIGQANTLKGSLTTTEGRQGSVTVGTLSNTAVFAVEGASILGSNNPLSTSSASLSIAGGSVALFSHGDGLTVAHGGVLTAQQIKVQANSLSSGDKGLVAQRLTIDHGGIVNVDGDHSYADAGLTFTEGTFNVNGSLSTAIKLSTDKRQFSAQSYNSTSALGDGWDGGSLTLYGKGEGLTALSTSGANFSLSQEGELHLGSLTDSTAQGMNMITKGGNISPHIHLNDKALLAVDKGSWSLTNAGNASLTVAGTAGYGLQVNGGSLTVDKLDASAAGAYVLVGGGTANALLKVNTSFKNVATNAFDGNATTGVSVKNLGTLQAGHNLLVDMSNPTSYLHADVNKIYVGAGGMLELLGSGLTLTQGQANTLKDQLMSGAGLLNFGSATITGAGNTYADINGHTSTALQAISMELSAAEALNGVKGGFKALDFEPNVSSADTPVKVMDSLLLAGGVSGTELVTGLTDPGSVDMRVGAGEALTFGGTPNPTHGHLKGKVTLEGDTALFNAANGVFSMDGGIDATADNFGQVTVQDATLTAAHVGTYDPAGSSVGVASVSVNRGTLNLTDSSEMHTLTLNHGTLDLSTPDKNLNIRDWANLSNDSELKVGQDLKLGTFTDGTTLGKVSDTAVTVGQNLTLDRGGIQGDKLSLKVGGSLFDSANGGISLRNGSKAELHALQSTGDIALYSASTLNLATGSVNSNLLVNGQGSHFTANTALHIVGNKTLGVEDRGSVTVPSTTLTQGALNMKDGGVLNGDVILDGALAQDATLTVAGGTLSSLNTLNGALTTTAGKQGSVTVGTDSLPAAFEVKGQSRIGESGALNPVTMTIAGSSVALFSHAQGLTVDKGGVLTAQQLKLAVNSLTAGDVGLVAQHLTIDHGGIVNLRGDHSYSDTGLTFTQGSLHVGKKLSTASKISADGRTFAAQTYLSTAASGDIWDKGSLTLYGAGEAITALTSSTADFSLAGGTLHLGSLTDMSLVGLTTRGGTVSANLNLTGDGSLAVEKGHWNVTNGGTASVSLNAPVGTGGPAGTGLHVNGGSLNVDKLDASAAGAFVSVGGTRQALLQVNNELKNVAVNAVDGSATSGINIYNFGVLQAQHGLLVDVSNVAGHYLHNGVSQMYVGSGGVLKLLGNGLVLTQAQSNALKNALITGSGLLDWGSAAISVSDNSYGQINGQNSDYLRTLMMDLTAANALSGVKGAFMGLHFDPIVGPDTPVNVMDSLFLVGGAPGSLLVTGLGDKGSVDMLVGANESLTLGYTDPNTPKTYGHLQGKVTLDGDTALFNALNGTFTMSGGVDASTSGFGQVHVLNASLSTDHLGNYAGNAVGAVNVTNGSLNALDSSHLETLTLNQGTFQISGADKDLKIHNWAHISNDSTLTVGRDLTLDRFTDGSASGDGKISDSTVTVGHDLTIAHGGLKASNVHMTVGGALTDTAGAGLSFSTLSTAHVGSLHTVGAVAVDGGSRLVLDSFNPVSSNSVRVGKDTDSQGSSLTIGTLGAGGEARFLVSGPVPSSLQVQNLTGDTLNDLLIAGNHGIVSLGARDAAWAATQMSASRMNPLSTLVLAQPTTLGTHGQLLAGEKYDAQGSWNGNTAPDGYGLALRASSLLVADMSGLASSTPLLRMNNRSVLIEKSAGIRVYADSLAPGESFTLVKGIRDGNGLTQDGTSYVASGTALNLASKSTSNLLLGLTDVFYTADAGTSNAGSLTTSVYAIKATDVLPKISGPMGSYLEFLVMNPGFDTEAAHKGVKFVSRALDSRFIGRNNIDLATSTIEGAAQLAVIGGAPAMTMSAAQAGTSAVTTRTSFASPLMDASKATALHRDTDGTVSLEGDKPESRGDEGKVDVGTNLGLSGGDSMRTGLGLWIMPLYQSNAVWGMESGNFKGGYTGDLGGVALGADYTFDGAYRVGLALNIGGGYAQSQGDFNKTENNFNFWGINLYGGWAQNNFGITADVGYTGSYNKLEQDLPPAMHMGNIKSDVTSYAITAGLRGEYKFETEALDIIPHVGVRYMGLTTDEYKSKSEGDTVFKVDQSFQSIWTFPIGVTLSKAYVNDSGWSFRPQLDLGITPAAGDVKAKSNAHLVGINGSTEMKMQIVDYMSYDAGLGFELKKDNLSFGLNYTIQASEHRTGQGVYGTFRYEF